MSVTVTVVVCETPPPVAEMITGAAVIILVLLQTLNMSHMTIIATITSAVVKEPKNCSIMGVCAHLPLNSPHKAQFMPQSPLCLQEINFTD